jgi:RNA polymerase sigma factor (sigma-70 family)
MNAILSGSAGVAVLVDGGSLFSIDIDRLDEVVPRRPREVPYLLGDAEDQQVVENVDAETVKRLLDEAWRGTETLQLALILMDGDLSDETRALAATELEEALGTKSTQEQVEAVLWSRPLPPAASIEGAMALCERAGATNAKRMFEQVRARQTPIREVWETFEGLPEPLFGDDAGDRARARAGLVREGAFRELVAAREGGKGGGAAAALLLRPGVRAVRNHRAIMAAWTRPLGEVRPAQGVEEAVGPLAREEVTDEVLMMRFQAGDRAAFATLVRKHKTPIYNFVLRFTRSTSASEDLIEDLVQEVFVRAVRGAADFRHESRFSTWVYTIARNVCVDHLREMSLRQHNSLDQALGNAPEGPTLLDRTAPSQLERAWRFSIETTEGERPLRCREVYGFGEAVLAAKNWRMPLPSRLVLDTPDEAAAAWLERWAEDAEQVRRRFTLRRADGVEVTLIATIASFGAGEPTSLVVESIRLLDEGASHAHGERAVRAVPLEHDSM